MNAEGDERGGWCSRNQSAHVQTRRESLSCAQTPGSLRGPGQCVALAARWWLMVDMEPASTRVERRPQVRSVCQGHATLSGPR